MNEQNNGIIVVDGTLRSLKMLMSYANSSSVFWVKTQFPCRHVYLNVGKSDKSGWVSTSVGCFHPELGMFKCYVSGTCYEKPCDTAYRVIIIDDEGYRSVCGEGKLRVLKPMISGVNDRVIENMLKFPDGLWRKVIISGDSSGSPTYEILSEGIDLGNVVGKSEVMYAYDSSKGKYYVVRGVVDEEGSYAVELEDSAGSLAKDDFVLDETTGFYRLMKAEEDESSSETLAMSEPIVG